MAYSGSGDSIKLANSMSQFSSIQSSQSKQSGGYDYDFVGSIHERFICSICTKVMRDPQLVVCCGQKFCLSCLKELRANKGNSCPHCQSPYGAKSFHYVVEKGIKNEIEYFLVFCPMHKKGCEWRGKLKEVEDHLMSNNGCFFLEVECPNKCQVGRKGTMKLPRKSLSNHLSYHCELRQVKCPYCEYSGTAKAYSIHEALCIKFPMKCPNGCEASGITRQSLDAHRQTCIFEVVDCEYTTVGCKSHVSRQDMAKHMEDCRVQHLDMIMQSNAKLRQELESVKQKMENLTTEVAERKSVVHQELALLEGRVAGDKLWLMSLKTQFQDPRCVSHEDLYFRMFQYRNIQSDIKDWHSPAFQVRDSAMCLHACSCASVEKLQLEICLLDASNDSLPLWWTDKLTIRIKKQGTKSSAQTPPLFLTNTPWRSRRARHASFPQPVYEEEYSWRMPENFSLAGSRREGQKTVLHTWKIVVSQEWEKTHVQDDSLVWTVCINS